MTPFLIAGYLIVAWLTWFPIARLLGDPMDDGPIVKGGILALVWPLWLLLLLYPVTRAFWVHVIGMSEGRAR